MGDRLIAWLLTGPIGRGLAFALDFTAAVGNGAATRRRARR